MYLSCSRLYNDYDGIQHDYTKKQRLVWQEVFLPARGLEIARSDLTIILRILLPDVIDPELVADRIVDHVVVAVVRAVWLSLDYAQRVGNSLRRPDFSVI